MYDINCDPGSVAGQCAGPVSAQYISAEAYQVLFVAGQVAGTGLMCHWDSENQNSLSFFCE